MKKTLSRVLAKLKRATKLKKTFDLFDKKLMRATKKTSEKKHSLKMFFIL